jgi:hypothetical protein
MRGPTCVFRANLTPSSLRQEIIGAKEAQLLFWLKMGFQDTVRALRGV